MLLYIFVATVLVQVVYYLGIFSRFSFARKKIEKEKEFSVSVLISCKNEAVNLIENLPYLLGQEYTDFEIVLIDDASTDTTNTVMQEFAAKHANITIVSVPKTKTYTGNKKNALTKGIAKAKNKHLIFTDADCIPKDKNWIQSIVNNFTEDKEIVLGYGAYKKEKTWLNKLIRYETLLTAWQYFSYAKIGLPYMGVGRNIAYTKSIFAKANGFESHKNIRSGDDDLFVNQIANKSNVSICWEAQTTSNSESSMADWLRQKRRHITTATAYKPIHQFLLGLFYLSQFLFYGLFFFLLFSGFLLKYVLLLALIRMIFYYISLIPTAIKLNEKDLILWAIPLELFLILTQLRTFVLNLWKKPTEW